MSRWFTPRNVLLVLAFTSVLAPTVFTGRAADTALFAKAPLERDICARVRLLGGIFIRTELVLGSAKPDGCTVTEEEFRLFLEQQVIPRFPKDLTLLVDLGQFRDVSGVIMPGEVNAADLALPISANCQRRQYRTHSRGVQGCLSTTVGVPDG